MLNQVQILPMLEDILQLLVVIWNIEGVLQLNKFQI
jgi:hypothetical protein